MNYDNQLKYRCNLYDADANTHKHRYIKRVKTSTVQIYSGDRVQSLSEVSDIFKF